jgi:hypothetical protein
VSWIQVDSTDFAADGIARRLTFSYPAWVTPPPASISDKSLTVLGYTASFKNYKADFSKQEVTFELTLSGSITTQANPGQSTYGAGINATGAPIEDNRVAFEPITLSVATVVGIVAAALGLGIVYFTLTKVEKATTDVVSTPQVSILVVALLIGVAAYALSQIRQLKGS